MTSSRGGPNGLGPSSHPKSTRPVAGNPPPDRPTPRRSGGTNTGTGDTGLQRGRTDCGPTGWTERPRLDRCPCASITPCGTISPGSWPGSRPSSSRRDSPSSFRSVCCSPPWGSTWCRWRASASAWAGRSGTTAGPTGRGRPGSTTHWGKGGRPGDLHAGCLLWWRGCSPPRPQPEPERQEQGRRHAGAPQREWEPSRPGLGWPPDLG